MPTSTACRPAHGWRLYGLLALVALSVTGCGTRSQAVYAYKPVIVAAVEATTTDESTEVPGSGADAHALQRAPTDTVTYRQTSSIRPASEPGSKLQAFAVAPDGRILALVQLDGAAARRQQTGKQNPAACEVRSSAPTTSTSRPPRGPSASGPRPWLWVRIIVSTWRVRAASPDTGSTGPNWRSPILPKPHSSNKIAKALREAAEANIEQAKESAKQMTAALEQQRKTIQAQIEKSPDNKQFQTRLKQIDRQIEQLSPKEQTLEQAMAAVTERVKRINAIAASDREVFITCSQTKGYGYGVWRTDLDFTNPKCIVTGLSGCCGQMDVCCHDGDLWVAENSRHRVVRYDREGKRLAAFGKRDRDGEGGSFGGCCNPMNLCFDKQGDLLVSESNGQVKRFTTKGEFVELAGVAQVQPGCKNSAVKASPDGGQIYYIDVQKSQILILDRDKEHGSGDEKSASHQPADRPNARDQTATRSASN